jgi:hypothetical protein
MKTAAPTAILFLLFAGFASAGETGIINQSGPYEATMKFYLHPAHGFPGAAEPAPAVAPVGASEQTAQSGATSRHSATLLAARSRDQKSKARASVDPRLAP